MNVETVYIPSQERYNGSMPYRRSGKSGVLLPAVSLGMWHNFGGCDSFRRQLDIAHYAFDHGITHFDLANNYGPPPGSAEVNFGRMMETSFKPYRDELFISTKAGHEMWAGPYGDWGSRKSLMASLDRSLKRMNLDYVDVFYSHRYDPNTPLEETLQALVDIVRQGKALYVGISKYPKEQAQFAYDYLKERDVRCLLYQGRYNMLNRAPEVDGIIQQAADNGAGFIAFSPLAQGLLTNRYLDGIPADSRMAQNRFLKQDVLTSELLDTLRTLNGRAAEQGMTLAEYALDWLLQDKRVTSVIVGASSVEQLATNIKVVERHRQMW